MCRCWGCLYKREGKSEVNSESKYKSVVAQEKSSLQLNSCSSRSSYREEKVQADILNNDRLSWAKGFTVEVYSQSAGTWFLGRIVQVIGDGTSREVKVVYCCKTKLISVFSQHLRPAMTESKTFSRISFRNISEEAKKLLQEHKPEVEPVDLDAFISYSQSDALDAAALLHHLLLKSRGVKTWFDQQQEAISAAAMSKGISRSCCFVIFLTNSYFERKFTVFELETALALEKQIVVVWEGDERHGGFSEFNSYMNVCPEKYKKKLFEEEALKFERRKHLQDAQINVIADRIMQTHRCKFKSLSFTPRSSTV